LTAADQLDFMGDGAAVFRDVVGQAELARLRSLDNRNYAEKPGARSFSPSEEISGLIGPDGSIGMLAASLCGRPCRAVRIIIFDKTADTNWAVGWHQDRTIAVTEMADLPGFRSWNVKDGICHVEPPEDILARMLTLRLHLDDCGADNGALRILPGTHRLGRVTAADALKLGGEREAVNCEAAAGDVLAMRLLTLHASARAANPSRRRVLHVDYSPDTLPAPLQWAI